MPRLYSLETYTVHMPAERLVAKVDLTLVLKGYVNSEDRPTILQGPLDIFAESQDDRAIAVRASRLLLLRMLCDSFR